MGVVVNLDEQTVSFQGNIARIIIVDAAHIDFGGEQVEGPLAQLERSTGHRQNITSMIDRLTGHMHASSANTIVVSTNRVFYAHVVA